jgi:hypothetical protein
MTGSVMNLDALEEFLQKFISTNRVLVVEREGKIEITPVSSSKDCTAEVRGMFSKYDNMTVDKFLERKRIDKELEG